MRRDAPAGALLFDLDGTLTDPAPGITRCLNHALRALGHAPRPEDDLTVYIGPPLDDTFRTLADTDDAAHVAALVTAYRERYGAIGYAENRVYDGVREALAALHEAGIPMSVCTSKRTDFAERILAHFDLRRFFDTVDGGDIGTPKWQQVRGLVDRGAAGPRTVMVGDRAVDVEAAHRNGLAAAAVLWGYGSRGELAAAGPQHLLDRPAQWLALTGVAHRGQA